MGGELPVEGFNAGMESFGNFELGFRLKDLPGIPQAHHVRERFIALVDCAHLLRKQFNGIGPDGSGDAARRWAQMRAFVFRDHSGSIQSKPLPIQ
jgi:hypothetical protein